MKKSQDQTEGQPQVGSDALLAAKAPWPEEVKIIIRECRRLEYEKIRTAGWCITCYRERAFETSRCVKCQEKHAVSKRNRNRLAGVKPWQAGKRGRPPKC